MLAFLTPPVPNAQARTTISSVINDSGQRTLDDVVPSGPGVQETALEQERVEEHENRCRSFDAARAIDCPQGASPVALAGEFGLAKSSKWRTMTWEVSVVNLHFRCR